MFLAQRSDFPGEHLPRDLIKGMGIAGNTLLPKSLTKHEAIPTINLKRLKANLVARNRYIFDICDVQTSQPYKPGVGGLRLLNTKRGGYQNQRR